MAPSQRYFPKWHLPKGIFPSGNFLTVQFTKRQLPKSVLTTALGPLASSCRGARPNKPRPLPLQSAAPNQTFGKLPLEKLNIWEVAPLEIVTWKVALGKIPNTKTNNTGGGVTLIITKKYNNNLKICLQKRFNIYLE